MNQENSENIVGITETNSVEGETYQDEDNQGEDLIDDAPVAENENQVDDNEKPCSTAESEVPSETLPEEPVMDENPESNPESNVEPDPNSEFMPEEEPLVTDTDINTVSESNPDEEPEIQGTDSQPADTSLSQNPKDKIGGNQKRGNKTAKAENCDKYGWPIGSKYCTEVNDPPNEVNFAEDVDLPSCEMAGNVKNKVPTKFTQQDEEVLFVVKSPLHRTVNTKRTIIRVDEIEGAITEGIHAGTHFPHFLNYLSLQVKFKLTLARLPDGKLKIAFRFVGKGGESLKNIICLWLRRKDEDKDKILFEGITRNKEDTLILLAQKFHEIESLKEDIVPLYEEVKKLVPEYRGKEGLRSDDESFLTEYRKLDNKLHVLLMLLYKDSCGCRSDSKLLSKFRDLYFSLQMKRGFTVKQYLYVFYCYNMIFAPYLPQDLEKMVQKYAQIKNITLPDTPPLVIPQGGQKSTLTVINPFAKKKFQSPKQENRAKENSYAEYEMVPVKSKEAGPTGSDQLKDETSIKKTNVQRRRQTYRRNRRIIRKANNQKNTQNPKILQGQRSIPNPQNLSSPRNNLRNQTNNRSPRNRKSFLNQRDNSFKQPNLQNARNTVMQRNQANVGNVKNTTNKRQQRVQGGSAAKKRPLNPSGSEDRETLPNPVASVDQGIQENTITARNPSNQLKTQNRRNRRFPRPRKNLPNQQNDQRNNQQNQRNNQQNQRNSQQNQRNSQQNQRNNHQNQRNNQPNQRKNQLNVRNEKSNLQNERNNQPRNSRSRRRSDLRKRLNNDQFFGMPDMSRNQGFSIDHELLLNSLRNQDLVQNNMRKQEMERNLSFNNDRDQGFSQSNSRNQNFSQGSSPRHNSFSQSNPPRSLFAQQFFEMPRNQNYSQNSSGSQNFSQSNSRRPSDWSQNFAGSSQDFFSGSNNFSNRSNSMNRNLEDMQFSNYNSRMSFNDDDMNAHNFFNSSNQHWNDDFNRGKRKNMRDNWNSKRSKQGI